MNNRDNNTVKRLRIISFGIIVSAMLLGYWAKADAQQFSVYAGLAVNYYRANSVTNYLNANGIGTVSPGAFTTAVGFFGGGDYAVGGDWELGLDYTYLLNSYTGRSALGSQQIGLSYSLPSLTIHHITKGEGFIFRYGGALGYHWGSVSVSSPYSNQTLDYTGSGFGLKLDASIDTRLDQKLYARIGVHGLAEFIGQPKDASGTGLTYTDYYSGTQLPVNLNLIGVGVSLGLVYYF